MALTPINPSFPQNQFKIFFLCFGQTKTYKRNRRIQQSICKFSIADLMAPERANAHAGSRRPRQVAMASIEIWGLRSSGLTFNFPSGLSPFPAGLPGLKAMECSHLDSYSTQGDDPPILVTRKIKSLPS